MNDSQSLVENGQTVTISCAEGDIGFVYEGRLPFAVDRVNLTTIARPKTKVRMNAGNPEAVLRPPLARPLRLALELAAGQ